MPRRLRIVVPGFLVGLCLSMFCGCWANLKTGALTRPTPPIGALLILFGPAGGPFAEPLAIVEFSYVRMFGLGVVLLAVIGLHPWRPGPLTGIASGIGLAVWFLLGFANTYYGV